MAWRVMTEKKHSTRLSQEHPVGVKCSLTLGSFASQALTSACLWVAQLSPTTCNSVPG